MPNCDFYGVDSDLELILDYVFASDLFRVYESYSPLGQELVEFATLAEVKQRYPLGVCIGSAPSVLLMLYPKFAGGCVTTRKISLNPEACDGHTFRYCVEGWGLISLQLGGRGPSGIVHSHTNHNSETRANKWLSTYPEHGSPDSWNWKEISSCSNKLASHIKRKLAVGKFGSRAVLPSALALMEQGLLPTWPPNVSLHKNPV